MQIEGVPEGWELVGFRCLQPDEWYIDTDGKPLQFRLTRTSECVYAVIRRIAPVCTWQHGVFANGWIAENQDGVVWWMSEKPAADGIGVWKRQSKQVSDWRLISSCDGKSLLLKPPVFRDDLPWTERLQQVGPTIEATLRGDA